MLGRVAEDQRVLPRPAGWRPSARPGWRASAPAGGGLALVLAHRAVDALPADAATPLMPLDRLFTLALTAALLLLAWAVGRRLLRALGLGEAALGPETDAAGAARGGALVPRARGRHRCRPYRGPAWAHYPAAHLEAAPPTPDSGEQSPARQAPASRPDSAAGPEGAVFAVAVGSGLLAYATLALGLLGLLYPWLFLALAGAAGVALRAELVPILRGLAAARRLLRRPATWGPAPAGWVAAVGVVCGAVLLCVALLPPFAYDALWYHLAAPQVFVQQHRFVALPLLGQANFPFTVEMLSTIGLLFGSDAGSAVLEFAAGAGLLVATWSFAARWFDRRVAWIAVAGLLTASDLHKLAAIADIDLALALFQFLALYAAMLWIERRQMGWLVLSALLAGLAAGSKYTALAALPLPALLVLSADGLRPRQWLANARPALALVGLALAVAAPWYLKNLVLYHNPFYPMLAGSLLDPALGLPAAPATAPAPRGLAWLLLLPLRVLQSGDNLSLTGRGLGDYLHLPLQVYLTGDLEMYGRPSLLFALAPLAFLAGRRPIVARLAAAAALESVVWALGPQELRYLAPAFPLYALLAAAAFDHLAARLGSPRLARLRLLMPLLALLSLTVVEDGYLFAAMNPLPVLAGAQSPAAFLGRVDTSYGAYRYLAGVLHPGERVLAIGEDRGYYAHIPILLDNSRDMAARVFVVPGSAQASAALLARARIAYVLVNDQDVQFQARVAPEEARREAAAFDQFSQRYLVEVYGAPGMHVYRFDAT